MLMLAIPSRDPPVTVPVTLIGLLPRVVAPAVTLSVVELPMATDVDTSVEDASAGLSATARLTLGKPIPVEPETRLTLTVYEVEQPRRTVVLDGLSEMLKS